MIFKIIRDYLKFFNDEYLHNLGMLSYKDFAKKGFFCASWSDDGSLIEFKIYVHHGLIKAVNIRQCMRDGKLEHHEVREKLFSDSRFGYAFACRWCVLEGYLMARASYQT